MRGLLIVLVIMTACGSPAPGVVTTAPPSASAATSSARAAPSGSAAAAPSAAPGSLSPLVWRRVKDIPTPRSEVAAAAFRGAAYVVGGFGGGNVAERYLPATDAWERIADLPVSVDHAMAAATDSALYVAGGNVNGIPSGRVFRWNGSGSWSELPSLPAPRSQGAAVAWTRVTDGGASDVVQVVGGVTTGLRLAGGLYEYSARTNAWREISQLPTLRDHLAGVRLDDLTCAVGGRTLDLSRNLATVECRADFVVGPGPWDTLPSAPTARGGIGAAVVGRRMFVIGGEQPTGTFREVDVYDAQAKTWSRGPDLPTPRHGLAVVAIGSTVYALSGGPTPGGSQTAICEALDVR